MAVKWQDVTSYSRDDKDRTPRTWRMDVCGISLSVTRRHGLDGWYLICEPWHSLRLLTSADADDAQAEAMELIGRRARELAKAFGEI